MRIVLFTLGSRGDVELFVILGRELHRRGHQVIVGTSPFHAPRIEAAGLEWVQTGDSNRDQLLAVLRSLAAVRDKTQRIYGYYTRWLQPQLTASLPRITALAEGADYFISNLKLVLSRQGKIVPGAAVTYDPPGSLEELAKYGTGQHEGTILDLVALSQTLVDPQRQWGEAYRFTGFWQNEQPPFWRLPPGLRGFVEDGPAPVVLTMGSMVMFEAAKLAEILAAALHQTGQRGILVEGWSEISAAAGPTDRLFRVREAPYDWLFPRASCIVHHGGCGTVAAALQAGVPSVILPQVACQEQLGRMLARENLVTGILDIDSLRLHDLAAAIDAAATDPTARQSAQRWRQKVVAEPGVRAAADLIEDHWKEVRHRSSPPNR